MKMPSGLNPMPFCALEDTFKTGDFSSWKGYRDISNEEIEILVSPESEY